MMILGGVRMKIEIKNRFTGKVIISGDYVSVRGCLEANRGADLRDADLGGADLRDADLGGADLRDAKNYDSSMEVFVEIIHRQEQSMFTEKEWAVIGKGITNGVCWSNIKEKFGDTMYKIFKKLAKVGFDKYLKHWEEL